MQGSRKSAVRTGALTGLSALAISGSAALAGAWLAHEFGRNASTDGFLSAYGVYLVLVLAAQAFRMVVTPDLTRAAAEGRLGEEALGYVLAFLALAVPASVLVAVFSRPLGDAITGSLPHPAGRIAGDALVWLVPAAFAQLFAALAASALAARDSYGVAALAYGVGAVGGVAVFVALASTHGILALAWGLAVNGAVAFGVPLAVLLARGHLRAAGRLRIEPLSRLWSLVRGAAVPLALQGLYLICVRLAADLGVGKVTTLSYAYLIAATLVSVTASSLSLVSSAPLTRRGLDDETAAEHVVHSAWLSLALIAAAAGVFGLVGGRFVGLVLGDAFTGHVGSELGLLVVWFAPWMVVAVAFTLTFPLVFVLERSQFLIGIAVAALVVHVPIAYGLREAFGLPGLALALAATTFGLVVALTAAVSRRMLELAVVGLGRLAVRVGAIAAASFGVVAVVWGGVPAALVGLVLYTVLLAAFRPRGLREAWAYVRALH
ncbi:MAG: Lipid flippase MurJ [Gaiellaceae bacterium]|jgi:O-antigen/teichoic acid export membrane protein|nr:Lipid flippase MurJ [Gaiellaceae bacterium]